MYLFLRVDLCGCISVGFLSCFWLDVPNRIGFLGLRLQTFILPVCQEGALPFNHNRAPAHTVAWRGSDNLPNPTPARILLQQAVEQKPHCLQLGPQQNRAEVFTGPLFSYWQRSKHGVMTSTCVFCLCLQSKCCIGLPLSGGEHVKRYCAATADSWMAMRRPRPSPNCHCGASATPARPYQMTLAAWAPSNAT